MLKSTRKSTITETITHVIAMPKSNHESVNVSNYSNCGLAPFVKIGCKI